jgi:hypothetical protein
MQVAQRISISQWCLGSQDRSFPVLAFILKTAVPSMYLPRSHTGNIFPSWTVVVRRHHVYVREFHHPSCYSVDQSDFPPVSD